MSKYQKPELDGHWQLVDLVYRNSGLRGNARLVAWSLAQKYYPKKGYSAYPVRQIAEDAGLSTKTILAALREIEESGEWNTVKKPGAATRFYPNMKKLTVKQPTFKKSSSDDTAWVERLNPEGSKKNDTPTSPVDETASVPAAKKTKDKPTATPKTVVPKSAHAPKPVAEPVVKDAPVQSEEKSVEASIQPEANVQKIMPDDDWNLFDNPGNILRPLVLTSPRSCATRLHKRTPLETRKKKDDFTVEALTSLYTRLSEKYPLQAVDTLLWIQCELAQPLNDKFLGLVLSKCTSGGEIIAPVKSKNTPADKTAMKVWKLHQARTWKPETDKKKRYQESL